MVKRERQREPKLSTYLLKHSPLKRGAVIKDEDAPLAKYNKIINRLYLGNYQAAKDKQFFVDKKIRAVLNCTKDIPNHFAKNGNIEYMRIPVDDSLKEKDFDLMLQFMPVIVEYIHKHVDIQKNNLFVNCYAGRQRSAIAVASYLVAKRGMTPHEACKFVLEKRQEAFHHGVSLNFESSLMKFYKNIQKLRKCN